MLITVCHLTLHDFLFYASREMGRLYETEKYLHNYGLTYALGLAQAPFANEAHVPRYQEELEPLNSLGMYVTPAHPLHALFAFHTFKMADVHYYNFTPQTSSNRAVFGRAKELAPESVFQFFLLSEQEVKLPSWIRLGKWMAKAQLEVKAREKAQLKDGSYRAEGAINPLDTAALPQNCNIIAMPPASLLTNASYTGHYYEISYNGGHVCLPAQMSYQPQAYHRKLAKK